MKKSDIYEIAIKVLGLYLVIVVVRQLRDVLAFAGLIGETKAFGGGPAGANPTIIFTATLVGFLLIATLTFALLLRTKFIARLICREEDYQEQAKLFAERKTVYEIALVMIWLITLIQTVPDFILRMRNYIQMVQNDMPVRPYDTDFLITAVIEIVLGLTAVICARSVSGLLAKSRLSGEEVN